MTPKFGQVGFWTNLEANLEPTWGQVGAKLGPKIEQNRSQERSKMQSFFDRLLEWVWNRFLMDFGPHLTPKMLPKWSQVGFQEQWKQWPAKIPKSLKNRWFFNDFGGFRGSKLEPKSIKNRSIMVSKTRSNFQWVLNGSWIDFGPILDQFWRPSWL